MILKTDRLRLRELTTEDAAFMLKLLNEPSFIRNIGDRGVRTLEEARSYISNRIAASYKEHGFGLWLVEENESGEAIGVCGLLKREWLEDVDLGYALLPEYWSKGYATEAASATVAYAREALGLARVVAITDPDNQSSIKLLERIGFDHERMVRQSVGEPELKLFARVP